MYCLVVANNVAIHEDLKHWLCTWNYQELYDLGARRIGVINAPPCGCLPSQRTLHGGVLRQCAEEENQASILFNDKLVSELSSLNQKLAKSKIVYLDIYNPLLDLITNPSQSGRWLWHQSFQLFCVLISSILAWTLIAWLADYIAT